MPKIGRRLYLQAMEQILRQIGYKYKKVKVERTDSFVVHKKDRKIYIEVAGKNLPYFGRYGKLAFLWEILIFPKRLDII